VRLDRVESTQREARLLADGGEPEGTVVVAREQTGGRGRLGRSWLGERGKSLMLTVILRPDIPAREAPLLSLGAAAELAGLLGCRVKWPNDLVWNGKKLGGILGEAEFCGDRLRYVLLGLGLNVRQTSFPEDLPNAISLRMARFPQHRLSISGLLPRVCRAILKGATRSDRLGLWREYSDTLGRYVRVNGIEGEATELLDDGSLRVGEHVVTAGDVELIAGPATR
jgi:BirA family biotin operon repressor/biotin-[acetyl-CoA-carboxylase] ligase